MNWLKRHPNALDAEIGESLSYLPSGGWIKVILLGIGLPVFFVVWGIRAWITQETVWVFGEGELAGNAAKAGAIAILSIALFCHVRWFWGLVTPVWHVYEIGTSVACLGIVSGVVGVAYFTFFY